MPRPKTTQAMELAFAKSHGLFRCVDCVREGSMTLYAWSEIERDHSWELADEGPHEDDNLFPRCIPHHDKKSKRNEKLRHHLDRAGKKHRGTYVSSKPKRPIANRKDAWPKGRTLPTGRKMQTNATPWGKRI